MTLPVSGRAKLISFPWDPGLVLGPLSPHPPPREAAEAGRPQGKVGSYLGLRRQWDSSCWGTARPFWLWEATSLTYQERGSRSESHRHGWNSSDCCYLDPSASLPGSNRPRLRSSQRQHPWQVPVGPQVSAISDLRALSISGCLGHCRRTAGAGATGLRDYDRKSLKLRHLHARLIAFKNLARQPGADRTQV